MHPANGREKQIAMLLEQSGSSVARNGFGRWEFALANGKSIAATARMLDEWLVLDVPVSDRAALADLWRLLQLNGALDCGSKFVVMPDNRSVHIRVDIALLDEEDADGGESGAGISLVDRVADACAGLKAAFGAFQAKDAILRSRPRAVVDSKQTGEGSAAVMRRRCEETGWKFAERSAESLVVDLNAASGFYQALIESRSEGASVSTEIARWDALGESSRQALGLLLLKTGALLRLVRPAIEEQEDHISARFEVRFNSAPSAPELDLSLSFLSVACSLCGRQAGAVRDEIVAREYLASLGQTARHAAASEAMLAAAD